MKKYRYSLDKSSKKYICPKCRRKVFVVYIDNNIGNPLHSTVGKCDRSDNCGYHYAPKQYFIDNHISCDSKKEYLQRSNPTHKPKPSFIDIESLKKTLSNYEQNQFVQWLAGIVGEEQTREAIERYFVGTSRNGGTCFWQIDLQRKIRTGKIIVYGEDGHRRKDILPPVQWAHKVLGANFILSQCLFGEHLLHDATKKVAIVESEKTAIIASIYLPDMIWLACGGSEGLNFDRCSVLKGRNVVLFPDSGQYDKWSAKAKGLSRICTVSASSLIEKQATEQEQEAGFDIADYLIRFSPQQLELTDLVFSKKIFVPLSSIENQFIKKQIYI
ncbi:DUF6371 domain-containing protein [Dysgonomonas sp. BGC7]|uniref:DUF6371 domain-containing protein n=1 Tax=Dysgonomonas sp. BGC7 TaxID=1658008 RepID=UPI000682270A|nr:DUF6371 domain-containing protein [Dysgonomonas sp. BGC7]MBD8387925.1 hypothetical protein [Dysgonomonas sp. BGC7]